MNIIFSLILFANLNAVAVLPEETSTTGIEIADGKARRRNRRALERMGK